MIRRFSIALAALAAERNWWRMAIDAANEGDTVLVSEGTYVENINFLGKYYAVTTGVVNFLCNSYFVISIAELKWYYNHDPRQYIIPFLFTAFGNINYKIIACFKIICDSKNTPGDIIKIKCNFLAGTRC